ncbi:hypothetical protein CERZMDRAFT_112456 [Cercospora zeae-maydis SCOH1-5]|uniref:Uncharacterized protein n=1 Tax=Cercospora zeae-maydis SCOH1-5 TaxID=717836 RepID=A0A6A6FEE8_9PEZI|nr:hypothetical protein CERZMDRAFT_112456 [Cercospora zeae-maydis SCOH1-5]
MRFSSFAAVGAFTASVFAAPAPIEEKRQIAPIIGLLNPLIVQVTSITGAINATASILGADATVAVDVGEVANIITVEVNGLVNLLDSVLSLTGGLTNLADVGGVLQTAENIVSGLPVIDTVTGAVGTIPIVGSVIPKRQVTLDVSADLDGVAELVSHLIVEVTATLDSVNTIVPGLDLGPTLTALGQTINNLLVAVENLVNGVLGLVSSILKALSIVNILNLNIQI